MSVITLYDVLIHDQTHTFDRIKNVEHFLRSRGITRAVSRRTLRRYLHGGTRSYSVRATRSKQSEVLAVVTAQEVDSFDKINFNLYNSRVWPRIETSTEMSERDTPTGRVIVRDELLEADNIQVIGYDRFFDEIIDSIDFQEHHIYRILIDFHNNVPEETGEFRVLTISTAYSNDRKLLWEALHRLYTKLFRYYQSTVIVGFSIDDKELNMATIQMDVSSGNVKQIRELMAVLKRNNSVNGKYEEILRLLDGKTLYVPNTYRNCMMRCLFVLTTDKPKMREKTLSNLVSIKKNEWFGGKRKVLKVRDYITKIAERTSINVRVHNMFNLADTVEVIQTEGAIVHEILLIGDHACAILPENKAEWTTELDMAQETVLISTKDRSYTAPKLGFGDNTVAFDFETLTDRDNYPFCVSMFDGRALYNCYDDRNVLPQFMGWLKEYVLNYEAGEQVFLYSHNGGKFDSHFILKWIMADPHCGFSIPRTFIRDGRLISFTTIHNKRKIIFNDSLALLMGSLDSLTSARGFDVEHKKKTGSVPFTDMISSKVNEPALKGRIIEYCNYDAMGLFEVLEKFYNVMMDRFDIDIRTKKTSASIAKMIFFKQYYDEETSPLYTLSEAVDKYIRPSYFGGRTDCFNRIGEIPEPRGGRQGETANGFFYYDFTSFYPTQMSNKILPYGLPIEVEQSEVSGYMARDDHRGFVRCKVRSLKKTNIPLHCVKHEINGMIKLIFPNFATWTEMTIYSEEIRLGLESGLYEYEFIDAIFFKANYWYKQCTDEVFTLKKDASLAHEPAKKSAYKVALNSLYGFWGIRRLTRSTTISRNKHLLYRSLASSSLTNFVEFEKRQAYMVEHESYMSGVESNVGIASAITSEARNELWILMTKIEDNGGEMLYCDTDSIICDLSIETHPAFTSYFENADELGGLKNEIFDETRGEFNSSPFLVLIGPKSYTLRGFSKMKGFSQRPGVIEIDHEAKIIHIKPRSSGQKMKLDLEHYRLLARGYVLEAENFVQFYGSVSSQYFSGVSARLEVPTKIIVKRFRMCYDKQELLGDGRIYPLSV